ncbi:MAG TPA: hypothetical protein VG125_09920 [Pirellulales bacterium]|nr:hypothetical protein [Pirellulales bacterium]
MKRLSVPLLAVAAIAWMAGQAGASDWANPSDSSYYGNAGGGGTTGYGAAGYGMAGYGSGAANFAPDMAGYGGPSLASYPQYGYAAYNYPGYGYSSGGYGSAGYGSAGYGGCAGCRGRRHCWGFGGNSVCCGDAWSGYCPGTYGQGVKVHRRHRALGCGAGPCVDGSCYSAGYATNCGRGHRCHLRRNRGLACCPTCGCSDCDGGAVMDQAPAQPGMSGPTPVESLRTPSPNEPPSPGDDSST